MNSITAQQLHELRASANDIDLIDVRTPAEYEEAHIEFARNIPIHELDRQQASLRSKNSDQPTYVICQSGGRSKRACEQLAAAGLNVTNVDGGTSAWAAAGLPVVRGRKTISLERQVRITAGSLVLLGAVLGFFVHPYFIGLSAFIGAGLMFSGITDTCGMGMVLARMPWNQARMAAQACTTKGSG